MNFDIISLHMTTPQFHFKENFFFFLTSPLKTSKIQKNVLKFPSGECCTNVTRYHLQFIIFVCILNEMKTFSFFRKADKIDENYFCFFFLSSPSACIICKHLILVWVSLDMMNKQYRKMFFIDFLLSLFFVEFLN